MQIWELLLIAVSLSMDAFAVAVCKGLSLRTIRLRHCVIVGLYFGVAQGLMPLLGYLLASTVAARIAEYSFYIAFTLLVVIGGNMIREAIKGEEEACTDCALTFKALFPMAIATSIDALAVGVSFALLDVMIVPAVSMIGITTFLLSAIGVRIGNFVGAKFQKIATIVGGGVLVAMGIKILLEGLGVL